MDENNKAIITSVNETDELAKFTNSYASFNRIINSFQRKYIELKQEFTAQNEMLVEANKKLVELSKQNITVTEFLNGILNSISAGVIAVDQCGRITHFNPAASIILGIPAKEPLEKQYRAFIPLGEPVDANALRAAETGKEYDSVEKKVELQNGTRLKLSVSTAILRDKDGCSVGAVEVFQDLTKIKKMEKEIARLNTLAALGEMAATIAHEVRNPLSGIGGFAALLERDLEDANPQKKLVKKIICGVNSLNDTVETLLNYTRFEEINKTDVNYSDFINSTIEQFYVDNQSRIEESTIKHVLNEIPSCEPISIKIDKMLFRQVFFNIFANSIEALNDNKRVITIQTRKLPRQTTLDRYPDKLMLGIDETIIETIITDNGPGIKQEHFERIFAPFFTTKAEGNGLGLAVAWKIIKAHGGEVFVENVKNGQGAIFYLLMPTEINRINMERKS